MPRHPPAPCEAVTPVEQPVGGGDLLLVTEAVAADDKHVARFLCEDEVVELAAQLKRELREVERAWLERHRPEAENELRTIPTCCLPAPLGTVLRHLFPALGREPLAAVPARLRARPILTNE